MKGFKNKDNDFIPTEDGSKKIHSSQVNTSTMTEPSMMEEKKLVKEKDPHEIPQIILDQLQASKINGFPFFAYTGIKDFVMLGNNQLMLKNIPRNPNHISSVTITYDQGRDMYNMLFQKGKFPKNVPVKRIDGVFFDQLSDIIVDTMGVR